MNYLPPQPLQGPYLLTIIPCTAIAWLTGQLEPLMQPEGLPHHASSKACNVRCGASLLGAFLAPASSGNSPPAPVQAGEENIGQMTMPLPLALISVRK